MEQTVYRFGKWGNAVILFIGYTVVSTVIYWLFVDPQWGVFAKTYPQPWFIFMFWLILVLSWFAFGGEMWFFAKLKQPWMGIVSLATMVAVVLLVIWLICGAWGHYDPTVSWSREGDAGKWAAGFIVLIGFVMYNTWFLNWQHWPWTDAGLKQPLVGIVEFILGTVVTALFYLFLIYPHFAPWRISEHAPLMSLPVTIGWYYAVLEVFLIMFILDNWPWSAFKKRWQMAIASFLGMFFFGTILYFILLWALKAFLLPAAVLKAIGPEAVPQYVAQLLVFTSAFVIFWGTIHPGEPWPTKYSPGVNRLVRLIIAAVWTVGFFYIYYYWFARVILHEPEVGGGFYGNALGFADWYLLINLIYFCCFAQWGMFKTVETPESG